ncbi:acyl-CoA dehydrogenase [Pantoea rodasii]|uniref:Acyl-CoA dehydrogenase n=1 Tax=Pantoea rodasii TaxID=1076549 RepID=A0A2M9W613_9GAMM|nr:acyl-CoA dehydrogenase family protein [Pantoea rodasii]ORM65338.1 hypothetical protein HA45_05270 [Pantoea rodasii]PJZ02949.1 acyl-CoA dehydrogenase [Pantoea rodasii]
MSQQAENVLAALTAILPQLGDKAATYERQRKLPYDGIGLLRPTGIFTLRVPEEQGGAGGTLHQQMAAITAIASVDSNLAQAIRPHFFFIEELRVHGLGSTATAWWPTIVEGALIGNALSEASTSRVGDITSTLIHQADGSWQLNGVKAYSTGSLFATLLYVAGQDADGVRRTALIPANRDGVTLNDDWDGMGQRLTASGTSYFNDVRVEASELLSFHALDDRFTHIGGQRQLFLSAVLAGIALNASSDINQYLSGKARPSAHGLTAKASDDPFFLRTAGDVSSAAWASRAVVLAAADSLDVAARQPENEAAALSAAIDVARAQVAVADLVLPATTRIFNAGGASAVRDELNLHRHWRNAQTVVAHNPLDYKRWAVANWEVNHIQPPRTSYF